MSLQTIVVYDLEITPYGFLYGDFDVKTNKYNFFIISKYKDERIELKSYLNKLQKNKSYQVGFNNLNYDYPLLHFLIDKLNIKKWLSINVNDFLKKLYSKNKQLIPSKQDKKKNKFGKSYNIIRNPYISQIDLFKIHHFDNKARMTSLKKVEINMRFPNVQDFDFNIIEDDYTEQYEQQLVKYNKNDIDATVQLYYLTRGQLDKVSVDFPGMTKFYNSDRLQFRIKISNKYNINLLNANDVKMGEEIAKITYLKRTGKTWYEIKNLKTFHQYINGRDLVPNYIKNNFKDEKLIKLLQKIDDLIIDTNNPKFDYSFIYINNKISFGLGGIHSEDTARIAKYDKIFNFEEHDVSSMYPSAIITLKLYPEHLGKEWLESLTYIRDERLMLKPLSKKDENIKMIVDVYKLVLNGNYYGKTGDKYNYQYDVLVKYSTTLKCQLDILLYAQMLKEKVPDLKIESWNTDGINLIYNKKHTNVILEVKKRWEKIVNAEMEITPYKKIIRRDVNNYIAIKKDNNVKLKGIFEIEKELHKNHSFQIIPIALYNYFIKGISIQQTFDENNNIFDYLGTIRVQNTASGIWILVHSYIENKQAVEKKIQKINRYYVTTNKAHNIIKKNITNGNWQYIEARRNTIPLNIVNDTNAKNYNIDYSFYHREIFKIINMIDDKQLKLF